MNSQYWSCAAGTGGSNSIIGPIMATDWLILFHISAIEKHGHGHIMRYAVYDTYWNNKIVIYYLMFTNNFRCTDL